MPDAVLPGCGDAKPSKGRVADVRSFLFDPRGPSGHSWFRRARFAASLFSPFGMIGVLGPAKDIYLEKFGLDATMFSLIVTIASFWAPIQDVLMGRLQDKEVLKRFFPVEKWGRRAPWLLTHGIIAAVGASVIYLPPAGDAAYVWFLAVWIATCWGICGCIIAFEASRQQIYPFKEERIAVEGLCKYTCMAGGGAGGFVYLVLSKDASFLVRLAFVAYILPLGLVSLQAVPIFREAKPTSHKCEEESSTAPSAGILQVLLEALPGSWRGGKPDNRALQHLLALKFWHGSYGSCIGAMLLYFVTYVLRLSSWERVQVLVGAGAAAGVTEAVMNLVFMHIFTKDDSLRDVTGKSDRQLLMSVVAFRITNALLTFLLIGVMEPSVPLLFFWSIVTRAGLCSFSFWRISAQCWLVDEDCLLATEGNQRKMREGQIFGALSMSQILASAIFSSLTFVGLGLAGFQTKNCEAACAGEGFVGDSQCVDTCFRDVIDGQPESLRLYVRFVIGYFAPLCELFIAYHTYKFPIKNSRLRKLYLSVAARRGEDTVDLCKGELQPYVAKSQIVLLDKVSVGAGCADVLDFTAADFIDRVERTVQMVGKEHKRSLSVRFSTESLSAEAGDSESAASEAPESRVLDTSTPTRHTL